MKAVVLDQFGGGASSERRREETEVRDIPAAEANEVADVLARMTVALGTADAYDIAARLWVTFGDRARAAAVRAEAQRALTSSPSSPHTQQ